jgi:hypothetical protein
MEEQMPFFRYRLYWPDGAVSRGSRVRWVTAYAHTVWTEIISCTSHVALWRFDGPYAKAKLLWRRITATVPVSIYGDGSL